MELVVRKTDLLRELQLFQGIVERKNTIPILANVLLEANGTEVKMLATDLEVGLRSKCPATVSKSGSLTLPAKKLYEIVKALPETDVRIEEDKGGVKVAADRFDSRMQTLPREDFPTLPEATGTISATLPRDVLRQMVSKTQFAITGEDTRYFLNGALFLLRPDSMGLVSTDGHRLAHITVAARGQGQGREGVRPGEEVRVILPRKTLLELGRLLAEGDGDDPLRARREPSVLHARRPAADLADDRRPVPGLRARHPEEQRQARRVRSRSSDGGGQARRAAEQRTIARGESSRSTRARSRSPRAARSSARRRKS